MSAVQIMVLGAVAGFTIFLGLPVGRLQNPSLPMKVVLNATATGVLLFLFWDVLAHAVEPVEAALTAVTREGTGSWMSFSGLAAVAVAAFIVGLMSLVYYEQWMTGAKPAQAERPRGPGAASVTEFTAPASDTALTGRRLGLLIAVGIGLHNFSEGLAIGQSAAAGEISLAILLIIGFGLHNATEGFGIVAPLAGGPGRPSWGFLVLLGLIGGGPTFLGTLVGQSFVNDTVSVAFLAAAAGSILYVIVQLLRVAQNLGRRTLMAWGLAAGLLLGFVTDFVVVAAGA
ncbi:ZIP family metal transporter (plasmid) [Mycolicibacterium rufum]|uniref:ZIP family metal transporter n=1 Tax=Mycolicibacterium rufum TaxID=318424 RepID=A0A9X3BRX9_9MYCO|nr:MULTISPECIES: zinc permease [Mycobacteriaceae]KGI66012.1 zinc permease [Mycolicibacterium rufum]MCV7071816.1 zinc permease [Mycolicibacterium rufum]MCX2715252.1 zinc permease [Mycolicibacterium sp. J2]MDO3208810.1 zinc permease [Mycobacteroides abscessus subsp. massiliense]ULP40034.1 ZIP family metal transporter [Mycolicibacterium rufum]